MPVLQESRGVQASTYIYEPGSYVPLARIDGSGAVEPHPAAAHALEGDAEQGKRGSVPTTNPQWAGLVQSSCGGQQWARSRDCNDPSNN